MPCLRSPVQRTHQVQLYIVRPCAWWKAEPLASACAKRGQLVVEVAVIERHINHVSKMRFRNGGMLTLALLLLLPAALAQCTCNPTTVNCTGQQLTYPIATCVVPGTTELLFASNRIGYLAAGAFASWHSAQTIDLSNNVITMIEGSTFIGQSALLVLDLSSNRLASVPSTSFTLLTSLETLVMSSNMLTALLPGAFSLLTSLVQLYLGSNSISSMSMGAFSNQTALMGLYLSNNSFTAIETGILTPLHNLITLLVSAYMPPMLTR